MKKIILSMVLIFSLCFSAFAQEKIVVFAAASTTNMLNEVLDLYNKTVGKSKNIQVIGSYASSGALARQIESGADASIFISANQDWMEKLEKSGLIAKSHKNFLGNELVLITNVRNNIQADLSKKVDFASILKKDKLVIGDPKSVPAGTYAKEALTKLGYWKSLGKSIVNVENVRVALAFVSRDEAPLGIVFKTDAVLDKNVKILSSFPENTHKPIVYPIGIIKSKDNSNVVDLYNFLINNEKAKMIYKKYGFK